MSLCCVLIKQAQSTCNQKSGNLILTKVMAVSFRTSPRINFSNEVDRFDGTIKTSGISSLPDNIENERILKLRALYGYGASLGTNQKPTGMPTSYSPPTVSPIEDVDHKNVVINNKTNESIDSDESTADAAEKGIKTRMS